MTDVRFGPYSPAAAPHVVALWAALTGGLHLDGLADCGDGLLAAATPERRLEIMRDSRLGAFGGLLLALFLILKVLATGTIPALPLFSIPPSGLEPSAWLPVMKDQDCLPMGSTA